MRRICWPIFIIAILLGTYALGARSATLDEVSTITITTGSIPLTEVLWREEGNMWFYYRLVGTWIRFFGDGIVAVRLFSVLAGLLTLPIVYMLAREFGSKRVAAGATLLLVTNLYFIFYAREARGYSLGLLLTAIAVLLGVRMQRSGYRPRLLFWYGLSIVLALYTSILTGIVFAVQFAYLAIRDWPRSWAKLGIVGVGIVVALLPWMLSPAMRGHQVDWLQPPKWVFLPMGLTTLAGDSIGIAILFFGMIAVYLWLLRKNLLIPARAHSVYWLVLWSVFPICAAFFFSLWIKPIYEPESFVTSLPPFVLLVALAIDRIFPKRSREYWIVLSVFALLGVVRIGVWTLQIDRPSFVFENKSTRDWLSLEQTVSTQMQSGDAIIFYPYFDRYPVEYYRNHQSPSAFPDLIEISSAQYAIGGGTVLPPPDLERLHALQYDYQRIWLVLAYNDVDWLGRKAQWHMVERELLDHYSLVKDLRYGQIELKLFARSS